MMTEALAIQAAERIRALETDQAHKDARIRDLELALDTALIERESAAETVAALHEQIEAAKNSTNTAQPDPGQWPDLADWVTDWLCPKVERQLGPRVRWCRRWQAHPEALMRLQLMHADYQTAMADTRYGLSGFVRSSLDYHLPRLLDGSGPFAACDPYTHEPAVTLAMAGPSEPQLRASEK